MIPSIPYTEEEYFYKVDNMVLSSSQHLRHVFKNRWKEETGENWVDDREYIDKKFIQGPGKKALKYAPAFQKKDVKVKCPEEWDVSLLALIIQNFGDESVYEAENKVIRKLKDMRNELAHHKTKTLTQEKYKENLTAFKEILGNLGMEQSDLDKLVERAGVTSSLKAQERAKVLFKEAEELLNEEKFDEAIERYLEAIKTPSLLPVNLGEAYEKRASCFMRSIKNQLVVGDHFEQALPDINQALELNSSSWNAHYLAARYYRHKNDLSEAIRYYEIAEAISPVQKDVKEDLDTCKVLAGVHNSGVHLDPRMMPINLNDRVALWVKDMGMKMSTEEFIHMGLFSGKVIKGQDHVFRGHQYSNGWGVQQDFTDAVKYYSKADSIGNPEGSYYLGQCYMHGRGTQQDVVKAMHIFTRVAEMDPNIPGERTLLKRNMGVSYSQHSIGLMYSNGIGVSKPDFAKAARWYERAMNNGVGNSANNLGILYARGQGVPLNEKMAEVCWEKGIKLKDVNTPASLVVYYITQLEPEKAFEMMALGREMGNNVLISTSNDEFDRKLESLKAERAEMEPAVMKFENIHRLDAKGLTFRQRVTRFTNENTTSSSFLPNGESDTKGTVETCKQEMENNGHTSGTRENKSTCTQNLQIKILEQKKYLNSLTRSELILHHRANLKSKAMKQKDIHLLKQTPKLKQTVPKKIAEVTAITLSEMATTADLIFENRIIDFTIIDEPNFHDTSVIILIAQDDNGDATRLYIHNADKDTLDGFQPGCRIAIINPYMTMGAQNNSIGIRNDEPRCIVYMEKVEKMCRFCGEENSKKRCSKCKLFYCSEECLTLDLKLDHKSICSLK